MITSFRCPGSSRKVDIRLHGKGNPNSHGARPVHQIISMMKCKLTCDEKVVLHRVVQDANRSCGTQLITRVHAAGVDAWRQALGAGLEHHIISNHAVREGAGAPLRVRDSTSGARFRRTSRAPLRLVMGLMTPAEISGSATIEFISPCEKPCHTRVPRSLETTPPP